MREPVLVLSGGAARGAAHLGFLAGMEAKGIRPKAIVGSSAGALMGALYSSWDCTTAPVWERVKSIGYGDILKFAFSRKGIFSSRHLMKLIRKSLEKQTFDELPVKVLAVATNWTTRSLEVLSSGDLASGLAASCALPPFFTPVLREGSEYLDGGILSILPVMVARKAFPNDLLIAVDVNVSSPCSHLKKKGNNLFNHENWLSMLINPIWLSIHHASVYEQTFADFTLSLHAGNYPLFSLRFIEKTYGLGYDEGMRFFDRKDVRESIFN